MGATAVSTRPFTRSPYVTRFDPSVTMPSFTVRRSAGAPRRSEASFRRAARPSAAIWRSCAPATRIDVLPAVTPWSGVSRVLPSTIVTPANGTSSSSATIWARPVWTPWPSSTWPLRAMTVPSACTLSHVASEVGSTSGYGPAPAAALAGGAPSTAGIAAVTTSAPPAFRNVRRLSASCSIRLIVRSSGHRLRGALDGGDDAHVGAAAAQVGRWRGVGVGVPDLCLGRVRRPVQQVDRHDHHPVLAVAALRDLLVDAGLLDRMQRFGRLLRAQTLLGGPAGGQALQRGHLALDGRPGGDARPRLAVADQH